MRLFYDPSACLLSAHIVAREAGIRLELEKLIVDKSAPWQSSVSR